MKHQAVSQITRSVPQRCLCPDQLYYHMHKNIYCFTSCFSVKVNRNWPRVASQILTVEPEAQHKYRGASECKCLLWILEVAQPELQKCVCVCEREEPWDRCAHTSGPLPRDVHPYTGFQHSQAALSFPQEGTQMLIIMGTHNICIKANNLK